MGERPGARDDLSRTLRELRQAAQLSTRDAAKRTGFPAAKISRVERGIYIPTETEVYMRALVAYRELPPAEVDHPRTWLML